MNSKTVFTVRSSYGGWSIDFTSRQHERPQVLISASSSDYLTDDRKRAELLAAALTVGLRLPGEVARVMEQIKES